MAISFLFPLKKEEGEGGKHGENPFPPKGGAHGQKQDLEMDLQVLPFIFYIASGVLFA